MWIVVEKNVNFGVENENTVGDCNQGYFATEEEAKKLLGELRRDYPSCEFEIVEDPDSELPEG